MFLECWASFSTDDQGQWVAPDPSHLTPMYVNTAHIVRIERAAKSVSMIVQSDGKEAFVSGSTFDVAKALGKAGA